ncbi:response regulator transcription factor, partial [Kitasatospora sp. NPDC058965]|uniref:response regulator transcription factor n=1 Tax=Kitasatospora sp. NPDC058965 TaxID=3346682 RepID=UPI0036A6D18D
MPGNSHIAIVEDQNLLRHGLERVLSLSDHMTVIATAARPEELDLGDQRPDAIVYGPPRDAELPTESIRALCRLGRVVVVGDFHAPQTLLDCVQAGALGCVTHLVTDLELRIAVRTVALGGFHVSPGLAEQLRTELSQLGRPDPRLLAPRELETVRWLAEGLTHAQIARRMGLTEATVSTYVKRIRTKLNVGNKADLTRTAIELGLLVNRAGAGPG